MAKRKTADPMTIEIYERKDGRHGVYITGDLTAPVPHDLRIRAQPIFGKVIDSKFDIPEWQRTDILNALKTLHEALGIPRLNATSRPARNQK